MRIFRLILTTCSTIPSLFLVTGCGSQEQDSISKVTEAWEPTHDPLNLGDNFERNYTKLPSSGKLKNIPWPGSYYPSCKGSIAVRENGDGDAWHYRTYSYDELKRMSLEQRSQLSPAEKIDIVLNNFGYPLVDNLRRTFSPSNPDWWGICDGWSTASLGRREPTSIHYRAKNGLIVPFSVSDIKALLIFNDSFYGWDKGVFKGTGIRKKCEVDLNLNPERGSDPDCKGVNAGTFHVVLANFIGKMGKGFVADLSRTSSIWNHPLFAYSFTQEIKSGVSPEAAPGTIKEIRVHTRIAYRIECSSSCETTNDPGYKKTKDYRYRLEINAANEIIGGAWESEDRPTYLWIKETGDFTSSLYAAEIGEIYKKALAELNTPASSETPRPQMTAVPTTYPSSEPTAFPGSSPTPYPAPAPTVFPSPIPVTPSTSVPSFPGGGSSFFDELGERIADHLRHPFRHARDHLLGRCHHFRNY